MACFTEIVCKGESKKSDLVEHYFNCKIRKIIETTKIRPGYEFLFIIRHANADHQERLRFPLKIVKMYMHVLTYAYSLLALDRFCHPFEQNIVKISIGNM